MAHAVKEIFPDAKLAIGSATEKGFYNDFDLEKPLTVEDLEKIEELMSAIVKRDSPFSRVVMKRTEAIDLFRRAGEEYKVKILEEIVDEEVSIYLAAVGPARVSPENMSPSCARVVQLRP